MCLFALTVETPATIQDVRVVRKFQMGKLQGGGGRDLGGHAERRAAMHSMAKRSFPDGVPELVARLLP